MIILLSLLPGVIILLIDFILSTPMMGINLSIFLSLMLAIIFGLVPTELGILKYFAWKENKKIKDIILFKEKTPIKKFVPSIIISLILGSVIFVILPQFEGKLWKIFDFIPDWFRLDKVNLKEIKYLGLSMILAYIFNGIIGPFVEELYFRGFYYPA